MQNWSDTAKKIYNIEYNPKSLRLERCPVIYAAAFSLVLPSPCPLPQKCILHIQQYVVGGLGGYVKGWLAK
jgi:hypothetical protein